MRLLAIALAAAWLGVVVASWIAASAAFRAADAVAGPDGRPEVATRLPSPDDRRVVTRHVAGEANRRMFAVVAAVQLILAAGILIAAWSGPGRLLAVATLAILLAQVALLGPQIETVGRSLDFAPRPLPAEVGRRFGLLHGGYVLLDLAKLAALGVLLARLR